MRTAPGGIPRRPVRTVPALRSSAYPGQQLVTIALPAKLLNAGSSDMNIDTRRLRLRKPDLLDCEAASGERSIARANHQLLDNRALGQRHDEHHARGDVIRL